MTNRAIYIRYSDGMPVTADEALSNGMLKTGYLMRTSKLLGDAAPMMTRPLLSDGAMKFMDSLPTTDGAQINAILADFGSNEVFRVRRAADSARALAWSLHAAGEGCSPGYVGDTRAAAGSASAYLHSLSDQAAKRVGEMYAASAQGDTTIDVGLKRDAAQAARDHYKDNLKDAWRGPSDPVPAPLTGDARTASDYAQAKRRADLSKAWEH